MTYYLAIDIGASSGRHILGSVENGKLKLQEVYRFENGFNEVEGKLVWNLAHLLNEVKNGIKECGVIGKIPSTVAIDTWGVDYVLLDENAKELLPAYCYRDARTDGMVVKVEDIISQADLYARTGIQKQNYNTIYQLFDDKLSGKLDIAKYFLMMPSYLSFKLTGVVKNEYTIATTTGLVNAENKCWDYDVIERLGYPKHLFDKLNLPYTKVSTFTEEVKEFVGFDSTVIFAPSHDTASAVAATPLEENDMFISSGTWSLIGRESLTPLMNEQTCKANFANEGGVEYRFRFLKNYMGMWMFQNVRKDLNKSLTYDEMMLLAENAERYGYFDVNDKTLIAPNNMIEAIKKLLCMGEMSIAEVLASIYHSLAKSYLNAVKEVERLIDKKIGSIRVIGGGSKDVYLNSLTAKYTGKSVTAGPVEATAVGNIIAQLIYDGSCKNLAEARKLVKNSF